MEAHVLPVLIVGDMRLSHDLGVLRLPLAEGSQAPQVSCVSDSALAVSSQCPPLLGAGPPLGCSQTVSAQDGALFLDSKLQFSSQVRG